MKIGQYFTQAFTSLLSNKLRSGLTILGIVIGVASVIAMMAVGRGAQASINTSIQSIGTNLLFVSAGATGVTRAQALTLADATALGNTTNAPDVAAVAPILDARTFVSYNSTTSNNPIVGTTPAYQAIESLTLTEGQFISSANLNARSTSPCWVLRRLPPCSAPPRGSSARASASRASLQGDRRARQQRRQRPGHHR